MLDHVSIGTRDIAAAKRFYDAALTPLGATCLMSGDGYLAYGTTAPVFWIMASTSPVPADPANGVHFCFTAPSQAAVSGFHRGALAHGGQDNGAPGPRPDYTPGYFAAFVVDPDGYRLEAHHEG
jgi:catechol 2,3-dioxygenase-like lactoylglutathione lyase family enzyme